MEEMSCTVTHIYSLTIQRELNEICAVSKIFSLSSYADTLKNTDAHIASLSKPYYIHLLCMEPTFRTRRSTYSRGDAAGCRKRFSQGGTWCRDGQYQTYITPELEKRRYDTKTTCFKVLLMILDNRTPKINPFLSTHLSELGQ